GTFRPASRTCCSSWRQLEPARRRVEPGSLPQSFGGERDPASGLVQLSHCCSADRRARGFGRTRTLGGICQRSALILGKELFLLWQRGISAIHPPLARFAEARRRRSSPISPA